MGSAFTLELLQKPQIVLDKMPNVVDAVLSHGDAIDAEAEGPAGINLRIDFAGGENIGMDHAAAAQLDPFLAVFEPDIDLGARFGEGKEAGAEADLGRAAEVGADELHDGAIEVHHGDVFIDHQCLELVEHEQVRGIDGVGAINAAGDHDAN